MAKRKTTTKAKTGTAAAVELIMGAPIGGKRVASDDPEETLCAECHQPIEQEIVDDYGDDARYCDDCALSCDDCGETYFGLPACSRDRCDECQAEYESYLAEASPEEIFVAAERDGGGAIHELFTCLEDAKSGISDNSEKVLTVYRRERQIRVRSVKTVEMIVEDV